MQLNKLKAYAPKARNDFIKAVTDRAALLGITAKTIADAELGADVVVISGKPWPRAVHAPREALIADIETRGFGPVMEAAAYSWFNRLVALRYMELAGYLDHGYQVIGHPDDPTGQQNRLPDILSAVEHIDADALPGLNRDEIISLKLESKDEELYRLVLISQCNAMNRAMPFLFEELGDATELLLPDHLLRPDSILRQLITEIPEEDWQAIEIIGWLYQFYISEKKDEVIGKVVKSEDIPAATQLFTPNWIVKYMVQNSLGAQWLATYPDSPLKGQMEYYIQPAEQTDAVNAQLAAITPDSLNPEELTLIDPACGSGHILVEAYDLFKAIYLERGYPPADVPRMILAKNLFGLDIDVRAAQLTGFALMMKGRADDRRLFERDVELNVMALVDSAGFDADAVAEQMDLNGYGLKVEDLKLLKKLFEHATTFGSLIQVPEGLASSLPAMKQLSGATSQDLFVSEALKRLAPLVQQAELLAAQYDAVVMNPPYMGSSGMNATAKKFARDQFPESKENLFACFIERGCMLASDTGQNAMVTMHNWMFLASFKKMRERMLQEKTIRTMAHLGARAFGSISGEVVQATSFVLKNRVPRGYRPVFFQLLDGGEDEKRTALARGDYRYDTTVQDEFKKIPGSPVAYWATDSIRQVFFENPALSSALDTREGLTTGSNDLFLRYWFEVPVGGIGFGLKPGAITLDVSCRWFPYLKGGEFRRWSGNNDYVVNWLEDGRELKVFADPETGRIRSHNYNGTYAFREGITWSGISSGAFAVRLAADGFMFDAKGPMGFASSQSELLGVAGLLNSSVVGHFLKMLAPTLDFKLGHVLNLPLKRELIEPASDRVAKSSELSTKDWDAYERSWDFQSIPLLTASPDPTLASSFTAWITQNRDTIAEMKRLEEENNRLFIDAYGLADELTPEVPIDQITLTVNPAYRYGVKIDEAARDTRFREDTAKELISYAVGCMIGRYSLDEPGLIYAHAGNEGFDASRYETFPADEDGVLPLLAEDWGDADDAANRLTTFIAAAWPADSLEANLTWLAESLSLRKKTESPRETLRRYLADAKKGFFDHHLSSYKKRPIYWMLSSGKLGAFQGLMYLHRYHAGTLARVRTQYVQPLMGKHTEQLALYAESANPTNAKDPKNQKRVDQHHAHLAELHAFDEKLHHLADQRITLDLDDGVKVNYGRFTLPEGDILARVKDVVGKKK